MALARDGPPGVVSTGTRRMKMLDRHRLWGAALATALLASPAGAETPRLEPHSARAFAVNQRLGRSVNIIGYDPIWQDRAKARFQERHFARIKEAGFDLGAHQPAPVPAHGRGERVRPEAVVARHARLGGEGRPRGPPGRHPRHARVPRHGRGPGGPQGGVALVLAAGGAAFQGRAGRRRLRAAERAVRQAHARAVERVPEGGPGRRPRHEPDRAR